jgi:hypothetical protein
MYLLPAPTMLSSTMKMRFDLMRLISSMMLSVERSR